VVAEQVRQRARKHHAESVAFTGRAAGSIELDHAHAYWVPLPERMLPSPAGIPASRIAVWCREGFDDAEIRALVDVRELVWGRPEDDKPARSYARRVLGDSVVASPEYLGAPDRERWAIFGRSTTWVSLTPFTTNRHQKRHQSDHAFLEDSVRRHLRHVALPHSPEEVTVEITDFAAKGFRAHRHPGARTPTGGIHRRAHVRLGFDSAVDGPVLLGSLSHFGLGTFVPEEI
jgi:CRISPR-associated protein Csb2